MIIHDIQKKFSNMGKSNELIMLEEIKEENRRKLKEQETKEELRRQKAIINQRENARLSNQIENASGTLTRRQRK